VKEQIQIFERQRVRSVWDEEQGKWWFSVLDIVAILTDQPDYKKVRNYWKWLKNKLKEEGSNLFDNQQNNEVVSDTNHLKTDSQLVSNTNQLKKLAVKRNELVTNCYQLKLLTPDGKMRLTDVADTEQILRIIQSIPSKKAEPFKMWLAQVGRERIDEAIDPEISIDRAIHLKLIINMLSEATTTELSTKSNPQNLQESAVIAHKGATVAKNARLEIEQQGGKVISSKNAKQLGKRKDLKMLSGDNDKKDENV